MAPNKKGGKNFKKSNKSKKKTVNPELVIDRSNNNEFYAYVKGNFGGNRLRCLLDNGNEQKVVIPGKFRKCLWFNTGDILHVFSQGNESEVLRKVTNERELDIAKNYFSLKESNESNELYKITELDDDDSSNIKKNDNEYLDESYIDDL
jgi:translation initiation factor IF-1